MWEERKIMTEAEKIMKKKAFIKTELDRVLPKAQSDEIWRDATKKLNSILEQHSSIPKGVRMHTDSRIFPFASIYLTAKERIGSEQAYKLLEGAAVKNCRGIREKLVKLMKIPGMPGLFVKLWDPMTKKMFGPGNGFKNAFYPKKKGEYRMDVISCPYNRYFTELGCPELTKIFCENDERLYGDLPGLRFERTGTIGKGADRCDFCMKKV